MDTSDGRQRAAARGPEILAGLGQQMPGYLDHSLEGREPNVSEDSEEDLNGSTEEVSERLQTTVDGFVSDNLREPDAAPHVSTVYSPKTDDAHSGESFISATPDGATAPPPDGGYGWVVVAAVFGSTFTQGILFTGFTVLYVAISEYFGTAKGETGLIGSLYMSTGSFLGCLISPLIERFGCRVLSLGGTILVTSGLILSCFADNIQELYFTFGILAGTGNGVLYLTGAVIVQPYFTERRTLAYGIAAAGRSLGSLVAGPVCKALLDAYGLRGTFLLLAGLYMHNAVFSSLFRSCPSQDLPPSSPTTLESKTGKSSRHATRRRRSAKDVGSSFKRYLRDVFDVRLFRKPQTHVVYTASVLIQFGIMTLYPHVYGRSLHIGIERPLAAVMVTVLGGATLAGRLLCSAIAARTKHLGLQYTIWTAAMATTVMLMPLTTSFASMACVGAISSVACGSFLTLQTPVLVSLFGVTNIVRTQALHNMFCALGRLMAVPFSGLLFDLTQTYDVPYLVCGGLQLLGAGFLGILCFISRKTTKDKNKQNADVICNGTQEVGEQ